MREHGQQTLVDPRSCRLDGGEGSLPFGRQPYGIHAGVTARALSLQQTFLDQPSDDVGQGGAIDPGLLHEARLADVRILGNAGEDRVLARRQVCLAGFIREQYLGTLTGPVQKMQGRNFESARAMVVLHGKLRRGCG